MRNRQGFTLIELMLVTIIIGVLATVGVASFTGARENSMTAVTRSEIRNVITAAELYRAVHGVLPPSIDALLADGLHQVSPKVDYCTFSREAGPPADLVIEAAHRGSSVHLKAVYPSSGVTMQQINAATDCS